MNYSTFDNVNFFIKKDSTLPELEYHLTQGIREQYGITDEMLQNVAVTFSMIDADSGLYRIANVPASIEYNRLRPQYPNNYLYTLVYRFKLSQTSKPGRYLGEFKLDFLGQNCGKLTIPTTNQINILISDGITKTTVV
jgi:hypothetical protein